MKAQQRPVLSKTVQSVRFSDDAEEDWNVVQGVCDGCKDYSRLGLTEL